MLEMGFGFHDMPLRDVIVRFLRASRTVDFVCIYDMKPFVGSLSHPPAFRVRVWSERHPREAEELRIALSSALAQLPEPRRSPLNTLGHYEWAGADPKKLYDYDGGCTMSDQFIEISLRATMDYLAGRITREEYDGVVPADWIAYLRRRLDEGREITSVSVSKRSDLDDDRLRIQFGDADPACTPFRPTSKA